MARPKRMTALAPTLEAATPITPSSGPVPRISTVQIGSQLGDRYDIVGYLGEGGMGAVYRAHDRVLKIDVALKSVRGSVASGEQLRDEVRVAQQVTHPNVCRIYDLVEVDHLRFIKMECITGETLAARLGSRGPFDTAETLRIARGVIAGLEAAHTRSIVHRDLKPGNVRRPSHGAKPPRGSRTSIRFGATYRSTAGEVRRCSALHSNCRKASSAHDRSRRRW